MGDDGWAADQQRLLSPSKTEEIARILRDEGPVVLEHRFYRGARAPARLIFDDFDEFQAYLTQNATPGDAFYAWSYAALCRDDNHLAAWKAPDAHGRTPAGGAY